MGKGWKTVEGIADSGLITTVYNLEIEGDHTYFVGCVEWGFSVWAHNAYMSNEVGVDLIINQPRILANKTLSVQERKLIERDVKVKMRALESAAKRGELKFTPDTGQLRISHHQAAYRQRVVERYERMYGRMPNMSRLDADHPVDLVAGGIVDQRLKLLHTSVNRSIGSSIKAAADGAGTRAGDIITSITMK